MARRDWASFAFLTAVLLSVGPIRTLAQTSFVVCLPSFDWVGRPALPNEMFHSKCLITRCTTACSSPPVLFLRFCRPRAMVAVRFFAIISNLSPTFQPEFTYDPLPDGYHYIGPTGNQNNKCQCSTVTYNTVSACGLCQNHTIIKYVILRRGCISMFSSFAISWDEWGYNCSNIYPGLYAAVL